MGVKMDIEIWKDIPDYEGMYQVSNQGRVRSVTRSFLTKDGKVSKRIGRVLKPQTSKYHTVYLSKQGNVETIAIHRLVLLAFVGPCPEGKEARHYPDDDKSNNKLDNLSWAYHAENCQDRIQHGTQNYNRGESHPKSKLTVDDIVYIRNLYQTGNFDVKRLATTYGVTKTCILAAAKGINWKCIPAR